MFDENRRIIRITSAAFKGYFPQHIESKYFASEIRHEYGWGDKKMTELEYLKGYIDTVRMVLK